MITILPHGGTGPSNRKMDILLMITGKITGDIMAKKKADERLETMKKKQKNFWVTAVLILVISISIFALYKFVISNEDTNPTEYQNIQGSGNEIILDTSEISDGNFHYYSYNIGGTLVKYFVVTDSNGEVHTAFDACEVCHDEKLGYIRSGDSAKCQNCGRTFSIYGLGTENADGGGCWPGHLPHTLDGSSIKISKTHLQNGGYLFPN